MEIENTDSQDIFGEIQNGFNEPRKEESFKDRVKDFIDTTLLESLHQFHVDETENENVVNAVNTILSKLKEISHEIIDNSSISEESESKLNDQQQISTETDYLSRKLVLLKSIRDDYKEEKEAWEENLQFFKNPLSLSSVEMTDCVFEKINDLETLTTLSDKCGEVVDLLHSVQDTKEDIIQSRENLVKTYQQYTLKRWNALQCTLQTEDVTVLPSRESIM